MKARLRKIVSGILISLYLSSMALPGVVLATPEHRGNEPSLAAKHEPKRGINPETGKVSFIGAGEAMIVPGVTDLKGLISQDRALSMVSVYGKEFGLKNPSRELKLVKAKKNDNGNDVVHYQQMYQGVPVFASEMIVNMNARGELLSISGEVASDLGLDTKPAIKAQEAQKTALQAIAELYKVDQKALSSTEPELSIFDESILIASTQPAELVWRLEVKAKASAQPIREMVFVNAQTGAMRFHFNQVDIHAATDPISHQAEFPRVQPANRQVIDHVAYNLLITATPTATRMATAGPGPSPTPRASATPGPSPTPVPSSSKGNRRTYTASGGESLPGTFLCDQSQSICTNGVDLDADAAHRYAADTFVFYNTHHQRNSIDNAGGVITSTVNYGINYQNAFWSGSGLVYGDNMVADDVVGHEITHGVTENTSALIYYGQSGAINESFSDVWGEFIDQTNGSGNDSSSVKWLIGEDSSLGVLRSMSNPPAYGHPDKMSSPFYYIGTGDSGGVHINSGVNNKAAYLMAQGGTFNGKTVVGIGLNKTAAVYYETQVNHLTMGANYNDLYYALLQACQNLIGGTNGITPNDCEQVRIAAEAVEMVPFAPPTSTPITSKTPTTFSLTSTPSSNPLYLSLTGSQTIGGVTAADEDILRFDGKNWSPFFDGSDVGVGTPDLSAFSIVDTDTILMSFSASITVNGVTAAPQDILRFDATTLGSTTIGTFSMYFDGSDVGFDDATSEKIDALKLLPDGRLLISTNGNPSVPGVIPGRDEDVLAFTSTSLGDVTSGTWAMYFDGSDVGLSETSGEDIDALDVVGNTIYLSAQDVFSVNGVSGDDDDIFVCTATSVGDTTACNYSSSLYFDGSVWGLTANDIDGFNFLASGSTPTVVPTNTTPSTPTRTPTRTLTATGTIVLSATHTSSVTVIPSRTATSVTNTSIPSRTSTVAAATPTFTATKTQVISSPVPSQTPTLGSTLFTFTPIGDSYVDANNPATNYGIASTLRVDASPIVRSYLRFDVQGLNGTVTRATLKVFANSASSQGGAANPVSDSTWSESTLNYNNAPAPGSALGSSGPIVAGTWIIMDVTAYITGNGTYNLALTTPGSTAVSLASRESGANAPQLIIETVP